jgi:MFS family permease
VHQTKYLLDIGFSANRSAWALGLVSLFGVVGQISLGHLSDQIGREWIWTISNLGFAICFLCLIVLSWDQSMFWLYLMVIAQGGLGYGLTSVMGAIVSEIFQGPNFGAIFGTVMLAALAGGAAGPWVTGALHDQFGTYTLAFWLGVGLSAVSAFAIWRAAPGKVRVFGGKLRVA